MSAGFGAEHDVALFADLAQWMASKLPDPTWLGFVGWLSQWLSVDSVASLRLLLPLDSPEQVRVEVALCDWLTVPSTHFARVKTVSQTIERGVDWPESWARSGRMPLTEFTHYEQVVTRDRELEATLAALALKWSSLLQRFPGGDSYAARAERLAVAVRSASRVEMSRASPLHSSHIQALRGHGLKGRTLARCLQDVLAFWCQPVLKYSSTTQLRLATLVSHVSATGQNVDDMLELTARIAIARAAVSSEPIDYAIGGEPWVLVKATSRDDNARVAGRDKPVLVLRAGPLFCELSKGRPEVVHQRKTLKARDNLLHAGEFNGLNPRGNEPDLVLTFWLESAPDVRIVLLGDAKRNATGDGRGYIAASIEVAAVYAASYGHLAGMQLGPAGLSGPVSPFVTLFCRQGARTPTLDREALTERLRATDQPLPFVLSLDLERHFGLDGFGVWDGGLLAAWFGRLARQVLPLLRNGGATGGA